MYDIDKGLSAGQLKGVVFLCEAATSKCDLYATTTPSVSDCYTALCDNRESQPYAPNILLKILSHVGCNENLVEDLCQLTLGSCSGFRDIHTQVSNEARKELRFRELLYDVNGDMTAKEASSFIYLSVEDLRPKPHPHYTESLLDHFSRLLEQTIISPQSVSYLCNILNIMGKQSTIDKIDEYCREEGIQIPKRAGETLANAIWLCQLIASRRCFAAYYSLLHCIAVAGCQV